MKTTLTEGDALPIVERLSKSNKHYDSIYPGDSSSRQPVHTVYGGANLFKAAAAKKLGGIALRNLESYAPNFCTLAHILKFPGAESLPTKPDEIQALTQSIEKDEKAMRVSYPSAWLAYTVYKRVVDKLQQEPIEDTRIDFEDGYGNRPDEEEDNHALQAANEVAQGMVDRTLPPFIGIRIKTFTEECRVRGVRTLDLFLTQLLSKTGGKLPDNFVVTLPKVVNAGQVTALAELLDIIEDRHQLKNGSIKIEIMIETPQCIIDEEGNNAIIRFVKAAAGRCRSAHFGTYDYTASVNITAAHQKHTHSACDFARLAMQVALAGTGVTISDGATTSMPIAPHKPTADTPLTIQQTLENQQVVSDAWKLHFDNITHSLVHAYYQSWDLNPAQLPIRYAAVYYFFLTGLEDASHRLKQFLNKAAQATLSGNTFDDAATGQGLLNFFLRGIACGAITEDEALATGITIDELRSRSFVQIVANRTAK